MKTKEIKLKTVKVKTVQTADTVVKKNSTLESAILPEPEEQHVEPAILESAILPEPEEQHVEPAILENNRTLDYKLKSGRVISAPCADEFFLTLSRVAKLEYLEFCVRNDLKLSDLQDNFC